MRFQHILSGVAALIVVSLASSARGQEVCNCDCYFSSDCGTGFTCDYGPGSFTVEDICWFRAPKPSGTPGANCDGDFGDWGQCDGKCVSSVSRSYFYSQEERTSILAGLSIWADAFTETSLSGGGIPDASYEEMVWDLPFRDDTVPYRLWRSILDVMTLARGADYIVFPKEQGPLPRNVAVRDLSSQPELVLNGMLAMNCLLAEIEEVGSGWEFIRQIDPATLVGGVLNRICTEDVAAGEKDLRPCLYEQIAKIGLQYRLAGTMRGVGDGPTCRGCDADCVTNDSVDLADLLAVLSDWGSDEFPLGDVNLDGSVDLADLLMVLSNWGPCLPESPDA